jgi:hypothetical protein
LTDDARHLTADVAHAHAERFKRAGRDAVFLPEQSEQDVLRTDEVVAERSGLVLREHDDLPGGFGEAFEHAASLAAPAS